MTHSESASAEKGLTRVLNTVRAFFANGAGILFGLKHSAASDITRENARRDVFEDLYYPNEAVLRS